MEVHPRRYYGFTAKPGKVKGVGNTGEELRSSVRWPKCHQKRMLQMQLENPKATYGKPVPWLLRLWASDVSQWAELNLAKLHVAFRQLCSALSLLKRDFCLNPGDILPFLTTCNMDRQLLLISCNHTAAFLFQTVEGCYFFLKNFWTQSRKK